MMIVLTAHKITTCLKGARLLIRGDPDPTAPNVTVLVCPVHNDKIVIPASWPRRRWSYVRTLSQGGEQAYRYLPMRPKFHREITGSEYWRVRKYRREHKITKK